MKTAKTAELRNNTDNLVLEAIPVVRKIALRVKATLPRHYLLDDLIAVGMHGAWTAAQKYDPTRLSRTYRTPMTFIQYAQRRIRGAMADWLRQQDPLTRHMRQDIKAGRATNSRVLTNKNTWEEIPARATREVCCSWDDYRHARLAISPLDRVILALYCLEHYKLADIADVFHVSRARISQRITNAKAILKLQTQREDT